MDPLGVSRKMWAGSTSREWWKHSVDIHCILRIFQRAICFPPIFSLFKLCIYSHLSFQELPEKLTHVSLPMTNLKGQPLAFWFCKRSPCMFPACLPGGAGQRKASSISGGWVHSCAGGRGWGKGEMFTGTLALQCDKFAHAMCSVSCARPETCGGEGMVGESHAGSQPWLSAEEKEECLGWVWW